MPFSQSIESGIRETLERRILHGLACEWEAALWVLRPTHRERMQKPLFALKNLTGKLGNWSREKREICLSRDLVLNHSWDSVRDVLLHEMAHQFVDQVLGGRDASPHGPVFLKACRLLRADPAASGKYSPLRERVLHGRLPDEDRVLMRVKKLLALAQSGNRHEAEAAMAKAHELIEKHNVELLSRNRKRNFVSLFLGRPALRHFRENYLLANLLVDFYFVEGIWVPAYVVEKGKMGRVMEISGTVQNVKIACYVHDYIVRYIDSQWQAYNAKKSLNRYRRTDFAVGIIEGFRSKLESPKNPQPETNGKTALMRIEDPMLKRYIENKYPRTVRFSRKAPAQDPNVVNDGIKIGQALVISKGITEKAKSGKLLTDGTHTP